MSVNLLNLFRERIEEQLYQAHLPDGITREKVRTLLEHLIPVLLTGAVRKASTQEGCSEFLEFLESSRPGTETGEQHVQLPEPAGKAFLQFLFDQDTPEIVELFSRHAGMRKQDVEDLLLPASTLFVREFDRYAREKSIDELGLYNLLSAQEKEVLNHLPHNIRAFPLIDLATAGTAPGKYESRDLSTRKPAEEGQKGIGRTEVENLEIEVPPGDDDSNQFGKILPWIILALASLALLWFLSKQGEVVPEEEPNSTESVDTITERVSNADQADEQQYQMEDAADSFPVVIQLPDSSTIATTSNSFTKKFYDMISGQAIDTVRSFILDDVDFREGTAELVPGSDLQLVNLARLLAAYPAVQIRIVAHTENNNNPSGNLDLSNRRADAIQNQLIENGIRASRVDIFGMGQAEPLVPNATEEGRNQNRRVEIVLLQK